MTVNYKTESLVNEKKGGAEIRKSPPCLEEGDIQEISEELFITVGTVKAHVHSIFGKLEVTRRSQLMTRFMELENQ